MNIQSAEKFCNLTFLLFAPSDPYWTKKGHFILGIAHEKFYAYHPDHCLSMKNIGVAIELVIVQVGTGDMEIMMITV